MLNNKFLNIALALLCTTLLLSCEGEEEVFDWVPVNSLHIIGDSEVPFGSAQQFRVDGFTTEKNYTWTLNGNPADTIRKGEFANIIFPQPGDYSLVINDGDLQDTLKVKALPVTAGFGRNAVAVTESSDTLDIPVNLTFGEGATATSLNVDASLAYTLGGTAVAGEDYELVSANPLVIPKEAETANMRIVLLNDSLREEAKTITATLNTVAGATGLSLVDSVPLRTYTITINDDLKYVAFTAPKTDTLASVDSSGVRTFEVSLSAPVTTDVTVPYTVSGTNVLDLTQGEVTLLAGQTTALIAIEVQPEAFAASQTISVTLGAPLVSEDQEVMYEMDDKNMPVGNTQTLVIAVPAP